jgi:hypothetical protein
MKQTFAVVTAFLVLVGAGCAKQNSEVKKITEELDRKNNEFTQVVLAKEAELKQQPTINNVYCYNQNKACFFALVIEFATKPVDYETVLQTYTKDLASAKDTIYQSQIFGTSYRVIGKFNDGGALKCEAKEGTAPNYNITCTTDFDPSEY